MNKIIIFLSIVLIILVGIIIGIVIGGLGDEDEMQLETLLHESNLDNTENILEENDIEVIDVSTEEEKISPNATLLLKTQYSTCGHEKEVYYTINNELVNKNEEELKMWYPEYIVEEFSSDNIVLLKVINEQCQEHYNVKDIEGFINIYKVLENGEEVLFERTDIATYFLSEEDKSKMISGIPVETKEKLYSLLENYN